jgi:hypothetical protein
MDDNMDAAAASLSKTAIVRVHVVVICVICMYMLRAHNT